MPVFALVYPVTGQDHLTCNHAKSNLTTNQLEAVQTDQVEQGPDGLTGVTLELCGLKRSKQFGPGS
jgi:hypothetical protein